MNSEQLEDYYPRKPISNLPPQTRFQFSRSQNILIQPNAQRSNFFSSWATYCEIVSETKNANQLRVSLPKVLKTITVTPYNENRVCISDPIPIPKSLNSNTFGGACQVVGTHIINMTGKCYEAVDANDQRNFIFYTHVRNRKYNPRLYATPGLDKRLEKACRKNTQTIELDFEGTLKMLCYDSSGLNSISNLVSAIEDAFNIEIQVPVPNNLQDIKYQEPTLPLNSAPDISI